MPSKATHPPLGVELVADGLAPRHDRDVGVLQHDGEREVDDQDQRDLDAVEQEQRLARLAIPDVVHRLVHGDDRRGGRDAHRVTFQDVAISSIDVRSFM